MSSQTFTREKKSIKPLLVFLTLFTLVFSEVALSWEIDFSRRRNPASVGNPGLATDLPEKRVHKVDETKDVVKKVFTNYKKAHEVVVLNTENGFVPKTIHMQAGEKYVVHVVNVNEKSKNSSFIMDAFNQHHSTYFGKMKSFTVLPKAEGFYSFQCPETSFQGKVVVYPTDSPLRGMASEGK